MKQFIYRINGQDYIVAVNKMENSVAEVAVNGSNYKVELVNDEEELTLAARPVAKASAPAAKVASAPKASAPAGGGMGAVKSPLPGIVVDVHVNVGDVVKKGQTIAMLEAMKMENAIAATIDGTVEAIHVNQGDSVMEGDTLITIA